MSRSTDRSDIAVVAASALFPGSQDEHGFWRDILAGRDFISDVPPSHWLIEDYYDPNPAAPDKTYAKRGAFLSPTDFDALGFGVPPSLIPATDTSQLLALIVAQRVLDEAAGGQFAQMNRERISVILGVTSGQEMLSSMASRLQRPIWVKSLREAGIPESQVEAACDRISSHYVPWQESTFPGLLGNVVAGRIANRFDLGGTNCVTDAACASAFSAVAMAVDELQLGHSDLVITGGVDTLNDIFMFMCFSKTPALSKTGDCRPFSDQADGTMLGEGLAMVALKRLEDAERDGDRVYAVLRGVGRSSDGRAKSVYAPRPEGQAKALRRAYQAAGFGPETVELIEAHGTGTVAGDAAEFEALRQVYDAAGRADRQWCALGTVKSQIGHTKAAAGAAGLFKVVMALHHGVLPPTIKVDRPNPKLELEKSAFYLNTQTRPWVRGSEHPRRAAVSSFGFGGSNFHLALEEYRGPARALRKRTAPTELVTMGAESPAALVAALRGVQVGGAGFLQWFARSSQESLARGAAARVAIVAADEAELKARLAAAADAIEKAPQKPFSLPNGIHYGTGAREGGLAFVFPGQGSQEVGMGAGAALVWPQALAAWDLAAGLPIEGGEKLQQVVFPRPVFSDEERKAQTERLRRTEWAQPGIGACSLAHLNLLSAIGVRPDCVGGHSFGEVMALHAAGAFDAATALRIARRRGELMAEAARTPGAMCAVMAPIDEVRAAVEGLEGVVVANHNAPKQVVLSGPVPAIERAEEALRAKGLRVDRLSVATAFHSPVVSESTVPFAAFLEGIDFAAPRFSVFANSEASPYPADPKAMRALLSSQLARPVRFVEQIEAMYAAGARTFVEVGPGNVLTGLVGRILAGRPHLAVNLDAKGKDAATAFHDALARLFAAGVEMELAALWTEFLPVADPRQAKKPKVAVQICGSNYGKPYPPPEGAKGLPPPNPERQPEVVVREVEVIKEVIKEVPVPVAAAPVATAAPTTQPQAPVVAGVAPIQPAVAADGSLLAAYQQAQRETVEAHAAWQSTMAQTHLAFLQASERSFASLSSMMAGAQPLPAAIAAPVPAFAPVVAQAPVVPVIAAPVPVVAPPAPVVEQPVQPAVQPVRAAQPVPQAPAPAKIEPAPAPRRQAPSTDLKAMLLAVVAEKTGYPAEMLTMEMGLESDLGIDSIKRVEILSAMREKAPELGEVSPGAMAGLKTLGAIVEHLQGAMPAGADAAAPQRATVAAAPGRDLKAMLLAVVAEKTGYPAEMLTMEMGLESDLGIDSIKRVEILSAMREKAPELGEVSPGAMAGLKTLGAIVEHLQGAMPASAAVAMTAAPASTSVPVTVAPSRDLKTLLLAVVAEKTGYPADMLTMEMGLESDLGIDSIKRVEILSAMREQAPELGEVSPGAMAGLKTLGAIVEHLQGAMPATVAIPLAAASAPARISAAAAPSRDLKGLLLAVVAEKTGYPADMLTMEMGLESDLGIDSIKRVEILSAMREQAPELGEVSPAAMAGLKTLGAIVEHLQGGAPVAAQAPAAAPVAAVAAPQRDLKSLLLAVVAEKTGYPADMLTMEMGLESDLGIDSIKRVEILSAMREQAPELGEVSPAAMAGLKTLGAIVEHLQGAPVAAAAAAEPARAERVAAPSERHVVEVAERHAPGLGLPGLSRCSRIVVTDDGAGVARALVAAFAERGIDAEVVGEIPAGADAVVFLGGLREAADPDSAAATVREAFHAARAVAARFTAEGGVFVSVQDTGGDFGLSGSERAWLGGIAGIAKTAAVEWPKATVKLIDLERGGRNAVALAAAISHELREGGADREVGLRADGTRVVVRAVARAARSDAPLTLDERSVVVATGGARGVTAACLVALAKQARCRFVLLGRSALADEPAACRGATDDASLKKALLAAAKAEGRALSPAELGAAARGILAAREVRSTVEAIRAAGGDARYAVADARRRESIEAALSEARQAWGPVTAIVHGAGVLADKLLAEKTDEQFDSVFDTKVLGLRALLEATAGDPLRAIVLFSSVAARSGNNGQSDYAAANEVLNKVACLEARRRGPSCVVRAIGWGPWAGGMVTPALKAHFEASGTALLPLDAGSKAFVDELRGGEAVEVVVGAPLPRAALQGESDAPVAFDMVVREATHPYLADHAIEGAPVLPVVLALEWFARAAKASHPELELVACHDVRVLKGARLSHFGNGGDRFTVACRKAEGPGHRIALELRGAGGSLHYTAVAEMAERAPQPAAPPALPSALESFDKKVYGEELFHGPEFQVIRSLDGVSSEGAVGTLVGTRVRGWTGRWSTDAAALDGGLQLALLWTGHVIGGKSLPTAVGGYHAYGTDFAKGLIRCALRGKVVGDSKTVCDISFVGEDGALLSELRGVEVHCRPDTVKAGERS